MSHSMSIKSDDFDHSSSHHEKYNEETDKELRRASGYTAISSIPPSLPADDIPHIHRKHRPAFRSPSSVRALQMSSPSPKIGRQRETRKWSQAAVKRFSTEIESDDESLLDDEMLRRMISQKHENQTRQYRTASATSTTTSPYQQQRAPLILLHVSILPCPLPKYSNALLEAHAPKSVVDNFYMLQEKLSDVVFTRGILIPHPGEEYDLLEERLLEALELCTPRVLGCGHFYSDSVSNVSEDDQSDKTATDEDTASQILEAPRAICDFAHQDKETRRDSNSSDQCETCERPIHLPDHGIGHGNRRWNVNFYAANGLMRAGAWSAAWREMERVDVEIMPWIPESVKRALDRAAEKELETAERERREQQLHVEMLNLDIKAATQRIHDLETDLLKAHEDTQKARLESIVIQEQAQAAENRSSKTPPQTVLKMLESSPTASPPVADSINEIPISRLLVNYISVLAQDSRNIALGALSVIIVLLGIMLISPANTDTASIAISHQAVPPLRTIDSSVTLSTASMVQTPVVKGSQALLVEGISVETASPSSRISASQVLS